VRLRFGDCVLDTDRRELRRKGQPVALAPKAFHLLEVLAESRPRAVSQAELRRLLWPGASVGGTTVARLLCEVRAAIDDQARPPRFIRTVQRFGYAFHGPAVEESRSLVFDQPSYSLLWGTRLLPLAPGENVIGRGPDAAINLSSDRVSRRHARIVVEDGRAVLEDLGSKHGTAVCDRQVEGPVVLKQGDLIAVGPVVLVFRRAESDDPTL
jgi:DNA-binding winged helix-turn-helix (wHTH) protein